MAESCRLVRLDTLRGPEAASDLRRARGMLADGGCMLIAGSNRLRCSGEEGLRSLDEWRELLDSCGMEAAAILYPFPNHTEPALVLTDRAWRDTRLNIPALLDGCGGRGSALPWAELVQDGVAAQLAPSFAIVARPRGSNAGTGLDPECLVYQYSRARLPTFRKQSRIRDEGGRLMVRRSRSHPERPGFGGYEHVVEDEPYVEGPLFCDRLMELLHADGWSVAELAGWARPWLDYLREHGQSELPSRFLDCVPFNLVVNSGALRPIDVEYTCRELLPLDFVAFRGIWLSLARARWSAPGKAMQEWTLADLACAVLTAAGIAIARERRQELIEREADFQHALTGADRAELASSLERIHLAGPEEIATIESQLFWRSADHDFDEQNSSRERFQGRAVRLPIRPGTAPHEVRFDIAGRPGLARLTEMRLLDGRGATLWQWDGRVPTLAAAPHAQMDFLALRHGGAVLRLEGNDPRLVLPASPAQLERLEDGGFFEAEFAWLESH